MKKPSYAVAMELRKSDKELDEKFNALPDKAKWAWLAFACENEPFKSIKYAKILTDENYIG